MRYRTLGTIALGAAAAFAVPAAASADTADPAELFVLHGVPDTTVDVWVNGDLTLDDFEPGDVAGPLELPADTYTVAITAPDAEDDSEPVIGPVDLPLESGMSYTAAAHLAEDGSPTATLFTNDLAATAAGEGRLTVRHIAAAPTVDVWANGEPALTGLEPGAEMSADLPAGTIEAAVAAAGTEDVVLGPADVPIEDGGLTVVYAWGSLEDDNLALATQSLTTGHSAPDGVPTGTVQVTEDGAPIGLIAAGAGAVVLAGLAAVGLRRRQQA